MPLTSKIKNTRVAFSEFKASLLCAVSTLLWKQSREKQNKCQLQPWYEVLRRQRQEDQGFDATLIYPLLKKKNHKR